MLGTLDRSTPAGQRDAAILLTGFGIAARRGELSSLDIGDLDFEEVGVQISVYRQKTRKMDDPVIHYRANRDLCPVRALEIWLATLAVLGRTDGPLFIRIDRHGRIAPPILRHGLPIGDPAGRMSGQAVGNVIKR